MLCVICIMSAALLYYDFVIIPRQNRELVEDLKSHFPEEFPPGGGSPGEKEEQAGRELEVPAVDFRSLQSQYPDGSGLAYDPGEWHRLSGTAEQPEEPSIICRGITGETTTSMEVCSSRQTVFWENPGI